MCGELSNSELGCKLNRLEEGIIGAMRVELFDDARRQGLLEEGDSIVSRRKKAIGKSIKEKHVTNIIYLVGSIKNKSQIEQVLMKNGKRATGDLTSYRNKTMAIEELPTSKPAITGCAGCASDSVHCIVQETCPFKCSGPSALNPEDPNHISAKQTLWRALTRASGNKSAPILIVLRGGLPTEKCITLNATLEDSL